MTTPEERLKALEIQHQHTTDMLSKIEHKVDNLPNIISKSVTEQLLACRKKHSKIYTRKLNELKATTLPINKKLVVIIVSLGIFMGASVAGLVMGAQSTSAQSTSAQPTVKETSINATTSSQDTSPKR